jgi:hypothetical protein
LSDRCAQTLDDVSGKEFRLFVGFLSSLKQYQSPAGAQELVDVVAAQAGLTAETQVSI